MSIDERTAPPAAGEVDHQPRRTSLIRRPWVVPLAIVAVGFVIYAVPPYLGLDPARARLQPMPDSPVFYPLLVTHIFLGSVSLLTACLQVWPWLRRRRPQVHRWSGRMYVAVTVPAALCVIVIAPMTLYGPNQRVANTMLGLLWLITTLAGYRAVRQRRFADHRAWMLRSVALAFSIVANRFWLVAIFLVFIPEIFQGAEISPAQLEQAVGLSAWMSWVVSLLAVEWWLHRRPVRRSANRQQQYAAHRHRSAEALQPP
jgi:uncharacterized membrane protein